MASAVIRNDDAVVAVGLTSTPSTGRDFALVRYLAGGAPDPAFGTGGKVSTTLVSHVALFSDLVVQPGGYGLAGKANRRSSIGNVGEVNGA